MRKSVRIAFACETQTVINKKLTNSAREYATIINIIYGISSIPYSAGVCGGNMSELVEYIRSNFKIAVKSVRFNYRKYLPFFAAVFIVGMLFGIILFSSDEASRTEREIIERDYDWHISLRDVNEDQYLYLAKYASPNNRFKPIYEISERIDSPGYSVDAPHYDIKLKIISGNAADGYAIFRGEYLPSVRSLADEGAGVTLNVSPLVNGSVSSGENGTSLVVVCVFLLSVLFLTVLYFVRINNYRFEYGIYMAFGADFRKLSENAIFEMLTVTLVTFLPSAATAYAVTALIHGRIVRIKPGTPFLILGLLLVCAAVAVIFPMFTVSRSYPMRNIIAEDNSSHVVSPRVSFEMLGKKMRVHYELFSAFRFRKYILKTITVCVAFMSAATGVLVASGMAEKKQNAEKPQFRLDFASVGYRYDEHIYADIMALDGVSGTEKVSEIPARDINSHIMLTDGETVPLSGFAVPQGERYEGFSFSTDNVTYRACDSEVIDSLKKYTCIGEPEKVLTEKDHVIVGEYLNNQKKLSLKPGDKIYVAISAAFNPDSTVTYDELQMASGKKLLKLKLEFYDYQYKELTVAAVLTDIPCGEELPVYMSEDTYLSVIGGDEVDYTSVSVYADEGLSLDEISALETRLCGIAADYGSFTVTDLYAATEREISAAADVSGQCFAAAIVIALISPVIWFFSQLIFLRKRYPEMDILTALGAVRGEINTLFLQNGIVTGVLSGAVSAALTAAVLLSVNAIGNYIGSLSGLFYGYSFQTPVFVAAVAISALLAFAASYLPGVLYFKNQSDNEITALTDE